MKNFFSKEFFDFKKLLLKMRMTCILLIVCASTLWASESMSQTAKTNISLNAATVLDIIGHIEAQTDYLFVYDKTEIDVDRKVNIKAKDQTVAAVLSSLFDNTNTVYAMEGTNILLMSRPEGIQQQNVVTGTIIDETGEGLPGVNVTVKGTMIGVMSDIDGKYSINIPDNSATLQFSFIGYLSQEVTVGNRNVINITLIEDVQVLDEVVVIGYGVQRKSDITGSISQVKVDEIMNRTIARADQALQGKTAGVNVLLTSGSPGASPIVRVRGFSSNASSDPLYIVDGLKSTAADVGAMDPNSIQSMEVLKDAASAAIYGAQAGNGVVLITTKKGSASGKSKISYDFQFTNQSLARMPKLMNAQQYINYYTEAGHISQATLDAYYDGYTDTNWAEVAFENSLMERHSLQMEGANEKGSFFMSGSYLDNDGIVKGEADIYKRYTLNLNSDYKIKPWLKISSNNALSSGMRKNVAENNTSGSLLLAVLMMDPLTPVYLDEDHLTTTMQSMLASGWSLLQNEEGLYYPLSNFHSSQQIHPLAFRDATESVTKNFQLNGTISAEITPFKGFTFTSRLGYRFDGSFGNTFNHDYYYNDASNNQTPTISSNTSVSTYYQWENFANYIFNLSDHNFTAMLGTSYSDLYSAYTSGSADNIQRDSPMYHWLAYASTSSNKNVNGVESNERELSYFGRLNYSYKGKYMLQASLRADAADLSKLSPSARWGLFPATSLGWEVSKENFASNIFNKTFSYFKLRASWGQNGSIAGLGNYMWRPSISSSGYYAFIPDQLIYTSGSVPSVLGNESLTWETSEQLNFGFDARFLNDKLLLTFDWFNKKTKDLIVSGAVPSLEVGNTSSPINGGNVLNTGIELELSWRENIGDFSYSVDANIATLNNEVTYITEAVAGRILGASMHSTPGVTAFEAGYPVWYFRGYKVLDIDNETGDPIFVDTNGDGSITADDMTYIGEAIPDFTYGATINLGYKGFDLLLFGSGSYGNGVYNLMTRSDRPLGNKLELVYSERWTEDNKTADRPRAMSNNIDKYWVSDAFIFDGSYFKIKQIQLGYTLPSNITSKLGISRLRSYVSLDDWFTLTSYPGFDPEASAAGVNVNATGLDKGAYPTSKKFVFGISVSF